MSGTSSSRAARARACGPAAFTANASSASVSALSTCVYAAAETITSGRARSTAETTDVSRPGEIDLRPAERDDVELGAGRALDKRTNDLTVSPGNDHAHRVHAFADLSKPSRSPL